MEEEITMRSKQKRIAARKKKRLGIKQPVAPPEVQIVEDEPSKAETKARVKGSSKKRDRNLTEEKNMEQDEESGTEQDERQEEENEEAI